MLAPFLLLRFGLLALLNRGGLAQAAHFAPMPGRGKIAYWLYQLANVGMVITLFFVPTAPTPRWVYYTGAGTYCLGAMLLAVSIVNFAAPAAGGLRQSGLYRVSRNPMYVAYFVYFLGCALLTQSPLLLGFLLVFQVSAHRVIRAEERWCIDVFGEAYLAYMNRVRRYI